MLGRISRGLGHKTGKKGVKYRFDVVVEKLDNLPSPVKKCRVVWSRGPKLQMTEIRDVNKGAVAFKQKLSQIATMYHDAKGGWEPKEYKFQIQVPGKEDNKLLTVGRADLDMSLYVLSEGTAQSKMLPILFKVGMASTGYLKISITAEEVASGTDSDDGMTEVSGMTGMTANLGEDQDLSGFDEDRSAQAISGPNSTTTSRPSSRMSTASPTKAEIKAAPAAAAVAPAAAAASKPSSSPASRAKPSAKAAAQDPGDDEISPMSLSPASSGELSQRAAGSKQPARAAGKPSVVDKKGAEDARAELFGTGKPSKPATSPSSSSYSTKQEPLLSEDDARAALFSTTTSTSSKRSSSVSTPAAAKPGKASSSSKQPAAPDPEKAIPPKAAAATSAVSPTAVAVSGASTISVLAAAGTGAGAGVRRGLLDRSSLQDKQQAQAPSPAPDTGPSSSKPAAYRNTHGHSLSDSDDDSTAPAQAGLKQPSAAANRALQGTAAASKAKQQQQQQPGVQPPASPAPPDASSAAASKVLSSENEKLKAQLLALRQQAAEAEESRRLAVLAADNAASERDEYRGQVQELQEQLKEALVSLMTQEEAEELKQELQDLRQQVAAHQQQQDQQDHQQQLHAAEAQAWRAERSQLQQAVEDAQAAAAKAQQHADKQLQQLQANADSQEGLVRHLSWQLEAAQQALQQQQHDDDEQQQQQLSQLDVGSAAVPGCVLAEVATDKACSAARILQFLADEVQELSRQEAVHQCLTDQLLGEASSAAGALELDGTVQGPVLEVLVGLRAAATALQCLQAEQAALQQSVASLTATLSKSQQEAASLQLLSSSQASTAAANIRKLQAEVTQLQQENMQLAMQQSPAATPLKLDVQPDNAQQQQGSPKGKTGMLSNKQPPSSLVGTSLIAAGTAADTPCKACASLQEQLSAAQHKTTKLTAARDKLEIILHDLEAASAEEPEQMEHQLAAANKAFRSSSQQLTSVQQQLKQTQQDLLDREQQLEAAKQQHEAAQEDLAEKEQQLGAAQQQLEEAQQQLQAAQQQLTRLRELPELSQQSNPQQAAVGSAAPPPSYEAATNAAAATAASATQVIAMAESAGPSGVEQALSAAQDQVADLQRQLAEAEGVRRGLEKDLARARKQLADEQSDRNTLEEHIITRLEDSGDDVAQETVAAYEAKYNRLKSRYRELTELHSEELDKLHDEINTLQERVVELEALAAQLEAARTQAQHGEVTLADTLAKASRATSELTTLRSENQMLTQNLIAIKMELALCCEREVIGRHELYKSRETNLKLASKMTKLETLVYANKK